MREGSGQNKNWLGGMIEGVVLVDKYIFYTYDVPTEVVEDSYVYTRKYAKMY
jgi:hypothetical protein